MIYIIFWVGDKKTIWCICESGARQTEQFITLLNPECKIVTKALNFAKQIEHVNSSAFISFNSSDFFPVKETEYALLTLTYLCLIFTKCVVYVRGDSMNGTPTVSWQRLCSIDRVKLKVTKSSVKS